MTHNFASTPVWSDDDWLKKFSGKTAEEAEAEAAGGDPPNTATKEVSRLFIQPVCSPEIELRWEIINLSHTRQEFEQG